MSKPEIFLLSLITILMVIYYIGVGLLTNDFIISFIGLLLILMYIYYSVFKPIK
jgi:ABC-type multidrug transport system permease subunit